MAGMSANNDIEQYVHQLSNPATRENALLELSKKRENFPELAPYLWYSFGTVAALLQEIVSIYPLLTPPSLTAHASNRVCNALALLQCVASHPETRGLFLQGAHSADMDLCPDGIEQVLRIASGHKASCVKPRGGQYGSCFSLWMHARCWLQGAI
jgi:hypothetical protein